MKHFLNGLSCLLVLGGILLVAGGCEAMCMTSIGAGAVCLVVGTVISNFLEKRGSCDEEED